MAMDPHDALMVLITTALQLAHGHGETSVHYQSPLAEALGVVDTPEFRNTYGVEPDWTRGDPVDDGEPITWEAS